MKNIIIENQLIKKELHLKSDRITGWSITNLTNGRTLKSLESGEEFVLNFKYGFRKIKINSSQLKVSGVTSSREDGVNKYTVTFERFNLRDSKIKVSLVYLVNDFRCYVRKYIELRYDKKGIRDVVLDSISFERFTFDSNHKYWTIPKQANAETKAFPLSLGQPVYVDCFFFGCEFPVAINKIEKLTAGSTYYSGRKLSELIAECKCIAADFSNRSQINTYERIAIFKCIVTYACNRTVLNFRRDY